MPEDHADCCPCVTAEVERDASGDCDPALAINPPVAWPDRPLAEAATPTDDPDWLVFNTGELALSDFATSALPPDGSVDVRVDVRVTVDADVDVAEGMLGPEAASSIGAGFLSSTTCDASR
ncbi:MAG TPA: hypothetical protein VNW54_07490 [Granulicella sp.]|nr:hypothetical protein [Granulicella sp.]